MIVFLSKFDASAGFDQIVDFHNNKVIHYALMVNPTIYVSCIKQFWATASIKKTNDVVKLQAQIDRKNVVVTEDIIRQDLRLDDADGAQEDASKQGRIEAIDADDDINLVDMETEVDLDANLHRRIERKDNDNVADKEVNVVESIVFNDEEVTMTMAQTLIKMKAEKARLLDEQMAKRQHDEEENIDWNNVTEQMQEKHLDNIRKYQSLKRKPISVAQARKNVIVYLKKMAGYKMENFKGMTYDMESFKKLKAVEVSGSHSTQDTSTDDPKEMSEDVKNMLEIFPVTEFKVEALQVKYPLIDWEIHFEGSRTY
nr:hypothetical protein [Tanacetum cinerariifolium]